MVTWVIATLTDEPQAETKADDSRGLIRALVADDFVHMQDALASCLESLPRVQVIAKALNGKEALEQVRQHLPDLAIVDLQMPVMDGFKLLRELRRSYPTMRLVAVSGHTSPAIQQEALAAGADAFVSKGQLPYSLVSTVEKLLG